GRLYVNLLIVMTLGGLWHGAANTFLVWGTVHGTALAAERALGLHRLSDGGSRLARTLWWLVVQTTVLVAWVFFRSPNLAVAGALLGNVLGGAFRALPSDIPLVRLSVLVSAPIAGHLRILARDRLGVADLSPLEKAVWGAVMLFA